jgi:hypothetical protein
MKRYDVWVNSDMTEGRGPMRFHSSYKTFKKAAEFVDKQCGVFGYTPKIPWSQQGQKSYASPPYSRVWGGDWEIRELEIK